MKKSLASDPDKLPLEDFNKRITEKQHRSVQVETGS